MLGTVQGYVAISPSDPSRRGLCFANKEGAFDHANRMNGFDWGEDWNKEYWGNEKPKPWVVYELTASKLIED